MSLGVHNNLAMMNASRQFKINTGNKAKSAEKLSSGYRINRSADDAAGLQISEKMRWQIRGLNRGTQNAQEGVSWIQTGDGALEEVHAILQRMRELTVQSLNDTNTPEDRAACQAEFDELQSEIDRITGTTQFNAQNIFDEHESPYYQHEGNINWLQSQPHVITDGKNDLVIGYRTTIDGAPKTATLTVPAGIYTTQELMDEIDDAITAQGLDKEGIVVEYTEEGICNLNLEGGEIIDTMEGGLSYLFYEMYEGGGYGALIGTTIFADEYVELKITNQNNHLEFDIEDFGGNVNRMSITIPDGKYTRSEIIDYLNAELAATDVRAVAYGTGIKLEGADSIVTGFKGNMFKIDGTGQVYHSVFYDNVKYGSIAMTSAYFDGGLVKPTSADQEEHQKYVIDSTNNELTFLANGATTPVTFTIPEGEYTVGDMVTKLNDLFQDNNLELSARISPNSTSTYQGIRIDSTVKGSHSFVGLDANSSAYNTLFVVREYNQYSTTADTYRDTTADRTATLTGAKDFTGTNIPLTVTAGVNDEFTMNVNGTAYTITLVAGTYASATDIASAINTKLTDANAPIGYKDKIQATVTGSQLRLEAMDGSGVKNITVAASGANTGYEDLFVKKWSTYTYPAVTGSGTVTFGDAITDPMTFDNTNNKFDVTFGGNTYNITIPEGTWNQTQLLEKIKDQLPSQTETISLIKFDRVSGRGTSNINTISISGSGETRTTTQNYDVWGSSDGEIEGKVGSYGNNKPATVTIGKVLPSTIEVTDSCNELQLTIDGTPHLLKLENKTYTPATLVAEIQKKINNAFPEGGRATVSLDNTGKLVFKADLVNEYGTAKDGYDTNIQCSTATSSFLKKLFTTETPATATSTSNLLSSITIGADSNTFNFTYKENGVSKTVNLVLDSGTGTKTYTRNELVAEINKQLQAGGHNVKADLNGNTLRLTTIDVGSDTAISYSSTNGNGGTSVEALFGPLLTETAATGTANRDIQAEITIDDTCNQFNVTVNNTEYNLTLDNNDPTNPTYDRTEFVTMLNDVFVREGIGLTATLNGNRISYTTIEKGSDASFVVTYDNGGSAMKAIYGESKTITPGLDVSLSGGKLTLSSTTGNGTVSVKPKDNGFIKPTETKHEEGPTPVEGYSSTNKAYIDGVDISEPIKIDQYNNELNFTYYADGASTNVSIMVPDGDYYLTNANGQTSIVDYLQSQVDQAVGSNQLVVSASNAGIRIEAVKPGSKYYMSGFSGDFYKKVLCSCNTNATSNQGTSVRNGTQTNDLAYIVGRKDVRKDTRVRSGVNDTLTLDFTYGNPATVKELTITLDAGSYSGNALVTEIQEKLDEALVGEGLEAGTIQAQIGGVSTGVGGSNDANALVFRLSPTVRLPADGQYIIDGVSGNAAFSIFYQTEGELVPAYVKGAKNISQGVTINPGETDMRFKVDSVEYTIQLTEGEHTTEELLDEINAQFLAVNAPLVAEMEDNVLKISHNKVGKHSITGVSGLAKDELFFNENGDTTPHKDIMIQLSANPGDGFAIKKPIVNTAFLKINSLAITKPKYANKALMRLDGAIARVSDIRSTYGSEQNRLEHTIANNMNTAENTQNAESRIRDTDMAEEMVNNARTTILEQAAMAMQAQSKQMTEGILQLLQ